jgi:ligand-binding SRPBCC domain-containing protein
MHRLTQKQHLPVEKSVLWDFVSVPQNLNQITPTDLAFKIIGDPPERAFPGLLLEYEVKVPVLGWTPWLTEIKYVNEGTSFMDEQRVGPYKLWMHTHRLEEAEGGTLMTDEIIYQVPFGIFGSIAHLLFVRRTLERIFSYRREKLDEIFPAG